MIPIVPYAERTSRLSAIFDRRASFGEEIESRVRRIISEVRQEGDSALRSFTERFDGVKVEAVRVSPDACEQAWRALDGDLRRIITEAAAKIRRFHERQRRSSWFIDEPDGVILGQRVLPLDRVGLYVPGGTAAYPSSVLMNAIPALVAGVREIHLCSPPGSDGMPHPLVLAAAGFLGIRNIYAVGGAQAIAAMAFGTASIPAVDKIVGPGNAYVVAAKRLVFGPVDIDSVAGPTEIVVLADSSANPSYVAADLLSQAEHDVRASAVLVTTDEVIGGQVAEEVQTMVHRLERRAIIASSLRDFGACVIAPGLDEAVELVNEIAPEHLELMVDEPWSVLPRIRNAGAIFLGPYSPEPVGDYYAGPNHVLPTGGTARYASPLGVEDFVKQQSVIAYSRERLLREGGAIARFAEAESLSAHAWAIQVRLNDGTAEETGVKETGSIER